MAPAENQTIHSFDWVFIGMGAGTGILLHQLQNHGLLHGKSFAIVEPEAKNKDDKTYCFWAEDGDDVLSGFGALISHSWDAVLIDKGDAESIAPKRYHRIRSIDLYNATRDLAAEAGGLFFGQSLCKSIPLNPAGAGGFKLELSDGTQLHGDCVFDSRPPTYLPESDADVMLVQSFVGFRIQLKGTNHRWDSSAFRMMDFEVEQGPSREVQFMYVLPEGERTGLIELTRFGENILKPEEAHPILAQYIENRWGEFEVLEVETGKIPMCHAPMAHEANEQHDGWISIGTRAGCVKPSTGYAFKAMMRHANSVCHQLLHPKKHHLSFKGHPRFAFYDHLLLLILRDKPHLGKPIFQQLFRAKPARFILEFLDESTSIWDEISMFSHLPKSPFLSAWKKRLMHQKRTAWLPMIAWFSVVLTYQILNALSTPECTQLITGGIMLFGMLVVGMPHGALDATTGISIGGELPAGFYARYLAIMGLMMMLWWWFPGAAVILFLLMSAWHFGQSDGMAWLHGKHSALLNWSWGLLLLAFLLITHWAETLDILKPLLGSHPIWMDLIQSISPELVLSVWILWGGSVLIAFMCRQWLVVSTLLVLSWTESMPLLWAFGSYFIFHHSLHGWQHLRHGTGWSHWRLWKKGAPFTAGAFLFMGLAIGTYLATDTSWQMVIGAFFAALSALSAPHILSSHSFLTSKK